MSAAEAPKSEQIQANVAAALSRLRGELGAASSPIAGAQATLPKRPLEAAEPILGPLPAGPVRLVEPERTGNVIRPFEPTLGAAISPAMGSPTVSLPDAATPAANESIPQEPSLFARREPVLSAEPSERAKVENAEAQPDLLSGMEVPPAPPPPLSALESEDEVSGRGRRMRNRLLAVVVLALIVGAGGWGYMMSHRAGGPVPIIAADSTPEKVKPADEGGMQVPNQNVQILDNMNGGANSQETAQVLPAPEQPVAPPATTDEAAPAQPQAAEAPAAANDNAPVVTDQPTVPTVPAPSIPSVAAPATEEPVKSEQTADATKAAQDEPSPAKPAATEAPAAESSKSAESQPAAPAPAAPEPTMTQTTEAPKSAADAPTPAETQTAAVAAAPTPAPKPAAAGGARIQLAAVKSEALAKSQWAKIQKAHPELLGALTLNIEKIDRNGTPYFRIQAGPLADKNAAKSLCSKLKALSQDCIVAK